MRVPFRMDPAEERRETKRHKEFINMQGYVADSEYGIPTRCPCGGRIIDEVRGKDDYDTLPGKRFFTCKKYEADGFHYRQPWVVGVQEHIERLTKRVEEVELVIKWVPEVNNQIERLEAEVKALNQEVDNLTGQVYNLSVQVADLEKLCFD
uniref:Zinc finger GRF-type domain-containing protein n=1 Tax=Brassica oleracea var. oleracea TaxID=109376 RepID=A0A0D3BTH5_BRAOL